MDEKKRKKGKDWATSRRAEIMSMLKMLEKLRRFDHRILSADQEFDSDKEFPSIDCELPYLFYSENYDERFQAFCLWIKQPLLNALRALSMAFETQPSESLQCFECFNLTAVVNAYPDLMNAAIKDMFENGQLESFRKALKDLTENGIAKLKECDVWNLAYFYNVHAILRMLIERDQPSEKPIIERLKSWKSELDSRTCHEIWESIKQGTNDPISEKESVTLAAFLWCLVMIYYNKKQRTEKDSGKVCVKNTEAGNRTVMKEYQSLFSNDDTKCEEWEEIIHCLLKLGVWSKKIDKTMIKTIKKMLDFVGIILDGIIAALKEKNETKTLPQHRATYSARSSV